MNSACPGNGEANGGAPDDACSTLARLGPAELFEALFRTVIWFDSCRESVLSGRVPPAIIVSAARTTAATALRSVERGVPDAYVVTMLRQTMDGEMAALGFSRPSA